jgi:DNA-binding NarL/FixJ family response regulator
VQKLGGNIDNRGFDPTTGDRESRNILVYTDDRLAGAGMASALKQIPDVSIDVIANEMDLVLAMESGKTDLVVVYFDCLLGDRAVVQDKMRRAYPAHATPVLAVLSSELEHVLQALELGARGLVMKTDEPIVLVNTARALLNGECYLAPAISTHIVQMLNKVGECQDKKVDRAIFEVLTKREKEVARMLALGLTTKQIAARTYITRATVKTHISNIMGKLNVDERSQIVALVYRSGWINGATLATPRPGDGIGPLRP